MYLHSLKLAIFGSADLNTVKAQLSCVDMYHQYLVLEKMRGVGAGKKHVGHAVEGQFHRFTQFPSGKRSSCVGEGNARFESFYQGSIRW